MQWLRMGSRCWCGDGVAHSKLLKFCEKESDRNVMEVLTAVTKCHLEEMAQVSYL